MTNNKKPGAFRQPGKDKSHPKRNAITAAQRAIHRRIEAQSEEAKMNRRNWHPEEYPDLYRLIESAKAAARAKPRLWGKMTFTHEGRRYLARFTILDRIVVEDRRTGRFLASSGFFAL